MNLDHPARPIPPPRPVDPAGAVDHAQFAWPTAPWTALTTRRPQAPQALRQALAQEELQEGRTATAEGGNINVQIGGKLGVLLTLVSEQFPMRGYKRIAVKVVDVYGNESTVVRELA